MDPAPIPPPASENAPPEPSSLVDRLTGVITGPGEVFAAYLVLTGVARFLVEFIRINPRSFLGMSNAQAAAAASVITGIILWRWINRRKAVT